MILSTLFQSWLAQIARCVIMSISALSFNRARWQRGQFLTLITRSTESSEGEESPLVSFLVFPMRLIPRNLAFFVFASLRVAIPDDDSPSASEPDTVLT